MMAGFERLGRTSSIALLGAGLWALGLVVAAFFVPVYRSESTTSSGERTRSSETLVGMNGRGVVVALAIPLVATVLVACALLLRARRAAMPTAWALTALLAAFSVLAMLTIGVFILPVTAALIVACASASRTRRRAASVA